MIRRRAWLPTIALAAGPLLPAAAQEPPATSPGSSPASRPAAEAPPLDAHGYLDLRYRYRSVPGEARDQDLFGAFGVRSSLPGVGEKDLRVEASGSFVWDLDEFPDGGSPFAGLPETFGDRFHAYLYEAYGEIDPVGPVRRLRAGRQFLWKEEGIRFDGLYAEAAASGGAEISVYGGVPVHFYESSRDGDLLAGAGVALRPWRRVRVSLDEIYVRDARDVPGVPSLEGDLLSVLGVEGSFDPRLLLRGSFSWLDAKERRQVVDAAFLDPPSGARVNLRLVRQNQFSEIPVTEFSPFVATLGVYEPFFQWQVDGGGPLVGSLDLAAGYARRRLIEGAEEGLFNHEFDHAYAIATLGACPWPSTSLHLRGDGWNGGGRDLVAVGGGLEARLGEKKEWRGEIGTDYALYRVDVQTGQERLDDRRFYGRVRRKIGERLDFGIGYRYEVDDIDRYHVADVVLGIRF